MLQGKLVRLRALELTDLERIYTWLNDPHVTRYVTRRYPVSRTYERRWLEEKRANSMTDGVDLAIETNDGVHIGTSGLHRLKAEDHNAHLGILIGEKEYWSNGYGTDAVETLLRFAFGEMNLNKISLHVFDFNERAISSYKKCGFQQEALMRDNYYGEGRYVDVAVMGVLRSEFEALHGVSQERAPDRSEKKA